MAITLSILDLFAKSFTVAKNTKFSANSIWGYLLTVEQRISSVCTIRLHFYSDFRQDSSDTAIDQWIKRLQACVRVNGGHFEHLLLTNTCKQFAFFSLLVQVASAHSVRLLDGR